jgi:hypothetical protein
MNISPLSSRGRQNFWRPWRSQSFEHLRLPRRPAIAPVAGLLAMTGVSALILLSGCNKSPFERTKDASGGGATGTIMAGGTFVIFKNELITGGSAFEYPAGENQVLSFSDRSNPISQRSIRYVWNGNDVSNPNGTPNPEHTFVGFTLIHVVDETSDKHIYSNTAGRDLHAAGYSKATFYARGTLSSNTVLKVEVAANGTNPPQAPCMIFSTNGTDTDPGTPTCTATAQLTADWKRFSMSIPLANLSAVKDFLKATFVFDPGIYTNPGQGGTVYFDVIQYEP